GDHRRLPSFPTRRSSDLEDTGLIVPVGFWVMEQACRQLREWQVKFPELQGLAMGVNVSGRQLAMPGLVARIEQIVRDSGIARDSDRKSTRLNSSHDQTSY